MASFKHLPVETVNTRSTVSISGEQAIMLKWTQTVKIKHNIVTIIQTEWEEIITIYDYQQNFTYIQYI